VRARPSRGVHLAHLTQRLIVLVDDVRVEERAQSRGCGVTAIRRRRRRRRVRNIEVAESSARRGASAGVEGEAVVVQLPSEGRVARVAVERCIDDAVAEIRWSGVAGCVVDAGVYVAVGSGHDDVEVAPPLACVCGVGARHRPAPEDAFDECVRESVAAASTAAGIYAGVAFEIDVEINSTIQCPVAGDVKGENGIKHVVVFASRRFEKQTAILDWIKGLLIVFEVEVVEVVFIRRIERSLIIEEECRGLC